MTLEGTAARRADQRDQQAWHDRYGHLLHWAAAYTRAQATRAEGAVRRAYRRGQAKPAWSKSRRDRHADAASEALVSALFYGRIADRLEAAGGSIGHRFTLKELAELEDQARTDAPDHLNRILGRTPPDAR